MTLSFKKIILGVAISVMTVGVNSPSFASYNEGAENWDVSKPRGETREISFTTDQGTWMSLDISPNGKWIVFDLLGHIYRLDIKGGQALSLTQSSGIAMNNHPSISPDGTEIAFVSDRAGQENLWVMDADGTNPRQIFNDMEARFAETTWTPDGKSIVATKRGASPSGFYRTVDSLWKYPRAGGEGEALVSFESSSSGSGLARSGRWAGLDRAQWASFTPDGKTVYFHSSAFAGTGRQLRRMDIETGHMDWVTENKDIYLSCCGRPAYPARLGEVAPEVSPDGKYLAFVRRLPGGKTSYRGKELNGRTTLWLRDLKTGEERIIMDPISNTLMDQLPSWHTRTLPGYSWDSEGKSIILTQGGKIRRLWVESGEVATIPFQAKVKRTISQQARGHVTINDDAMDVKIFRWPTSTKDGSKLVYEAVGDLWIKDLKSGNIKKLTSMENNAFPLTPSISPNGKWVTFTTSDDLNGGHVWKVGIEGGKAQKLSQHPGIYLNPKWSRDGKSIVVSQWPLELNTSLDSEHWQFLTLSAQDGSVISTSLSAFPNTFSEKGNDRITFVSGGVLKSSRWDGSDVRDIVKTPARASFVAPSPDGKWLALGYEIDIYITLMPQSEDGETPEVDIKKTGKRVSFEGGNFPHWRDKNTLEFVGPKSYYNYNLKTEIVSKVNLNHRVKRNNAKGQVALVGARILTMENRKVIEKGTVIISEGRILCVGECDTSKADEVLNFDGKTIMPGWVDLHAHHLFYDGNSGIIPQHRPSSANYLANGVTTVNDPSVNMIHGFSIGEMIEAGKIVGPRTYGGPAVTCGGWSPLREIAIYEDAENIINWQANLGVIQVKDYKQCNRIQRTMLAEATRGRGLSLTSEGSDLDYIMGLIMTGHAGWEHPLQILPIYKDVSQFFGQAKAHYSSQLLISDYPLGSAIEYRYGGEELFDNEKLMSWNPWKEVSSRRSFVKKPREEFGFPIAAEAAADIKRAGGYIGVGAHGEQNGLDTHWEVWTLSEALEPIEALEAATMDSAHFLGLEEEIGSISVGKLGDVVILNSNPIDNIRNSTDIAFVMKAGRLFDGTSLDEVWPNQKAYGPHPWINENAMRRDIKADDYWDKN
ncbi:MAG: amidohydrolase family protein [Sphingomonadales bacterium]